jgi:hypothetical protein
MLECRLLNSSWLSVRLFADDCILYRQIYNHDDSTTLQQDLDNLAAMVSSTNKIDCHDVTEILLKVVLNNSNPNPKSGVFFTKDDIGLFTMYS